MARSNPYTRLVPAVMLLFLCCIVVSTGLSASPAKVGSAPVHPPLQWTEQTRLKNQAVEALNVLTKAPEHGMPASRYALEKLTALATELNRADREILFNELLTAALETYAIDLLQGLQPSAFKDKRDPKHSTRAKHTVSSQLRAAVLKGLHRAITTNRVAQFMSSIEPAHADYKALQTGLKKYRQIVEHGGWPAVPRSKSGRMLLPGDSDPRVVQLRERLGVTAKDTEQAPQFFDESLKAAVIRFQHAHGLKADGKVGKNTRAALNVSAEKRLEQIELNLDRWRLMPKRMPANHIWVNVPQYEMKLQLEHQTVLDMRVVVGAKHTPTPMMHDRLEHVVFSPYWHLPQTIVLREILPKVKADPAYLQQQRFDVLENNVVVDPDKIDWQTVTAENLNYRFRQRPGSWNSLGKVKFIFPNNYAVYLHDTKSKNLFDRPTRAFSHGCIRLEHPEALAASLLEWDRGWKRQKVSRAMASSQQKYVKLEQTVPVYLVYFTVTVDDGALRFHNDIYGHDKRHNAQRLIAQENLRSSQVANVLARHEPSKQIQEAVIEHAPLSASIPAAAASAESTPLASAAVAPTSGRLASARR